MIKKIFATSIAAAVLFGSQSAIAAVPQDIPSVHIIAGSNINLLATDAKIPVRIKNDFNSDLKVHVHAVADNGRLTIPVPVEISIPANTAVNAQLPVKAIGSGDVQLTVWLETFSGLRIGDSVKVNVNVNSDAEGLILFGFGASIVVLGVFGVLRTLRKRRKQSP